MDWTDAGREIARLLNDDSYHQHSHDGIVFLTTDTFTALTDGATKYYVVDPSGLSDTVQGVVENFVVSLSTEALVHIYRDPTLTDKGTVLTTVNANLKSTNTNEVVFYADPTISSNGTEIHPVYTPGVSSGSWRGAVGGSMSTLFSERILSPSHIMLVGIENVSGVTMDYGTFIYRHREEVV